MDDVEMKLQRNDSDAFEDINSIDEGSLNDGEMNDDKLQIAYPKEF